jgi:hypothetical protein
MKQVHPVVSPKGLAAQRGWSPPLVSPHQETTFPRLTFLSRSNPGANQAAVLFFARRLRRTSSILASPSEIGCAGVHTQPKPLRLPVAGWFGLRHPELRSSLERSRGISLGLALDSLRRFFTTSRVLTNFRMT